MVAAAVTVGELLAADLGLEATVVTAGAGSGRVISAPRIQKPGLALTGWDEQLHDGRLLILGGTEVAYLSGCDAPARALAVATMLKSVPAAVMIARGLAAPPELIAACDAVGVPVVASALITSDLIVRVTGWLAERMAPQTSIHGVLLDVLGIGILLLGPSGIGKSETALDLVVRGHRLVADDIVIIRKKAGFVFGSGSGIIRHHMEIRGLGIINIKDLFGVAAIREAKKVELVVELVEWDANEEYDRLGLDDTRYTVLDVQVPMVRLPVRPGRNLSTIIEVAARNQLLKRSGIDAAHDLVRAVDARTR